MKNYISEIIKKIEIQYRPVSVHRKGLFWKVLRFFKFRSKEERMAEAITRIYLKENRELLDTIKNQAVYGASAIKVIWDGDYELPKKKGF